MTRTTFAERLVVFCERIFFWEGVLMLITGVFITFFPHLVLQSQGVSSDPIADANQAQFGCMVILMGYVGVRAKAVPHVLEAALLGDFLWLYVFIPFITRYGIWNAASLFSAGITVFLAASRTTYFLARRKLPTKAPRSKK
eukprot:TRINITY_DN10244_c0_g1_i2.p1 TRINITY_DN10244_c0_g1~~TRINITY_DN10244_c0_g1_i2.p1  ORF type:complete len:141 (-),score=19.86 TRINITY_DN10244_c0_g1_i2:91-513(-)